MLPPASECPSARSTYSDPERSPVDPGSVAGVWASPPLWSSRRPNCASRWSMRASWAASLPRKSANSAWSPRNAADRRLVQFVLVHGEREHQPEHEPAEQRPAGRAARAEPPHRVERQFFLERGQAELGQRRRSPPMSPDLSRRPAFAAPAAPGGRGRGAPPPQGRTGGGHPRAPAAPWLEPPRAAARPAASARRRDRGPAPPRCPRPDRSRSPARPGSSVHSTR